MKYALLFLSFLFLSIGCKENSTAGSTEKESSNTIKDQVTTNAVNVRDTFDCKIFGKKEKGSGRWLAEKEMFFAMTNDIFQDEQPSLISYNVFQVYNTLNCNLIYNGKLPLIEGVKSPYKLQVDIFDPINQMVCTQSPERIYCYHVRRKEMVIPLAAPIHRTKTGTFDPNSKRDLTTWKNYLFGWTEKIGVYGFDMSELRNPPTILRSGTYSTTKDMNYLFVLDTSNGVEVLVSEVKEGVLTMHPIFNKSMNLNRKVYREKSGGRYAFFKSNVGKEFVAIDLADRKLISLPTSAMASTLDVKAYLQSLN